HHLAPPPRTYLLGDADLDPSGANAFDNASHRYEITVPAALAMPPIDAVAGTQRCSHASPPRLGQQSPHHLLGLFQSDGATLFVEVSGDSPIVVGFIGSHVQVISNPLHPSPQRLVLFTPPLGLGAGSGELVFQAPLFGVGRCALLDGHPRALEDHATIWAPLLSVPRHVR